MLSKAVGISLFMICKKIPTAKYVLFSISSNFILCINERVWELNFKTLNEVLQNRPIYVPNALSKNKYMNIKIPKFSLIPYSSYFATKKLSLFLFFFLSFPFSFSLSLSVSLSICMTEHCLLHLGAMNFDNYLIFIFNLRYLQTMPKYARR